jgi:AcrR family transcriptional regulator
LASGRHGLPRAYIASSQRERLREAMVRVAAEKGYAATTITEVVEAAGVSTATFYELFDDKESCFLEAFGAVNDVVVAHVAAAYRAAAGDSARRIYADALARFVPFLEDGREYAEQNDLPADTARFAIGAGTSMIFDEIRAGRGADLEGVLPDLVFAVLMPYLGPEAAEAEMRRVAAEADE